MDIQDLMGAAALGKLDASEQAAFDAWLEGNDAGQREFAEALAAVAALPLGVEERDPSPALRDRVAAAIAPSARDEYREPPGRPASIDEARSRTPVFLNSPAGRLLAAAAALAIVVIGAFAIVQALNGETTEDIAFAEVPEGFEGSLEYSVDDSRLEFHVDAMPAPPEGQIYQVWLIRDNVPESKGVMTGDELEIDANRSDYDAFAITLEPGPGGSTTPTSEPILVAPLAPSDEGGDV
jgi:anti-sigma-K factor RskA